MAALLGLRVVPSTKKNKYIKVLEYTTKRKLHEEEDAGDWP